jgi:hypothetical protein
MSRLVGQLLLYGALAVALGIVAGSACAAQPVALPSDPESPNPSAQGTATPRRSLATPGASVTASPSGAPSVPRSPTSTPAAACPRVSAGGAANQAQLTAMRVAHQPGFDRLVFEFGPSTAPGTFGMPAYTIEATNSLSGPSGQSVPIDGKALFGARFMNTSTRNVNGSASYSGSLDLRPATPLIKEARLVEDFERVLVWGVGLDHLVCPKVSELANPYRVVLDFASAP